jgi:hypothetical protein
VSRPPLERLAIGVCALALAAGLIVLLAGPVT